MRARGLVLPDADAVASRLRAAGAPHPRPRVVVATGQAPLDDATLKRALAASLLRGPRAPLMRSGHEPPPLPGLRPEGAFALRANAASREPSASASASRGVVRCGVAIAPAPDGSEVLVAVAVEALADLAPLPTRARTGEWLSFDARVHAPASRAKLVILPPHGVPRTVPTSIDASGMARARFALDQPGGFTVQLLADLEEGPRPVLEARIFADVMPPAIGDELPAPGETGDGDGDTGNGADARAHADALAKMVAALRASEALPRLARDDRLDALARAHAERMRDAGVAAHDLGDGDPRARFEAEATFSASAVGENVAHAPTTVRAHRALYASPSHRMNLLRAEYTHLGVGVAVARDGSVYTCETFATVTPR